MLYQLKILIFMLTLLSACTQKSVLRLPEASWSPQDAVLEMDIVVKTAQTPIPLQAIIQLKPPRTGAFTLLHGPTVGKCEFSPAILASTTATPATAHCEPAFANIALVLNHTGQAVAQILQALGPKGQTAAQIRQKHPGLDMYFSDQTVSNKQKDFICPQDIYYFNAEHNLELSFKVTRIN